MAKPPIPEPISNGHNPNYVLEIDQDESYGPVFRTKCGLPYDCPTCGHQLRNVCTRTLGNMGEEHSLEALCPTCHSTSRLPFKEMLRLYPELGPLCKAGEAALKRRTILIENRAKRAAAS